MKRIFLVLVLAVLAFIVFLPTIASSPMGARIAASLLSSKSRKVSIDQISLHWLESQEITNVRVESKDLQASIPKVIVKAPLWKLFIAVPIYLDRPEVKYHYSLESPPSAEHPHSPSKRPGHKLAFSLSVNKGKGTFIPQNNSSPAVVFENIDLEFSPSSAACHADGIEGKERGTIDVYSTVLEGGKMQIEGTIQNFPSTFLQVFPRMNKLPSLMLGDRFNSNFSVYDERIHLYLSSPLSTILFDGKLSDKILSFTRPLEASITVTPELSNMIFAATNFKLASSQDPVRLWVASEGTQIPINDLKKGEIPLAYIDLGRAVFFNAKNLTSILSVIQLKTSTTIPIWFQKAPLHFSNGVLNIERTEFLLDNSYELAAWGNIDFHKKGGYVDMYVGITAQALSRSLGLKSLPSSFVLPISCTGPFDDIKVHKSDAIKQLAILIGREQHPLGALVPPNILSGNTPIPPPRKPFPWN